MILTEINLKEKLENLNWDFQASTAEAIHSIHPYPAKFIPEIPRTLISNLPIPPNTIILDPFCGSGVTLVESQKAGIESVGVDLNPIACLLSKVKTQKLSSEFLNTVNEIVNNCATYKRKITIPQIPNLDHWFKKEIQKGLTIILNEINKTKNESILNALKYCLSSIIVRVSNQDSDTRYASVENQWEKEDVFSLFKLSAEKLWKAKNQNILQTPSQVINKNSLLLEKKDFSKKVGLVITSPPYPNAYEYWLYHKYRMWWLGYDPIDVKENEIGARAHYFKKNHQTADDFVIQMETLFNHLWKVCAKDAFICFVIGQSKIHGEIIENEKMIASIGKQVGLNHITTLERVIRPGRKSFNLSHARIKEEFIVILQK
jgi:site-specific DNA-methyltransferase (cytosine-N4-specific)